MGLRGIQKFDDSPPQTGEILDFALPYHEHRPAELTKSCFTMPIAEPVSDKFVPPKLNSRLGSPKTRTTAVEMPKTPVHEDDLLAAGKNKIGRSGQVFPVQPEPIA